MSQFFNVVCPWAYVCGAQTHKIRTACVQRATVKVQCYKRVMPWLSNADVT